MSDAQKVHVLLWPIEWMDSLLVLVVRSTSQCFPVYRKIRCIYQLMDRVKLVHQQWRKRAPSSHACNRERTWGREMIPRFVSA